MCVTTPVTTIATATTTTATTTVPSARTSERRPTESTSSSSRSSSSSAHASSSPATCWLSGCLLSVLLLFSATVPSTMSAPIGSPSPKWVNPCGVDAAQQTLLDSREQDFTIPAQPLSEIYNNIALQAKLAKEQADSVSPEYVIDAFKDPNFPEYSKDLSYNWLPQIERVTKAFLDSLTVEQALQKCYEYLQYYAVGIEQILQDQILYDGDFLEQFRQMEGKLRQVLCEIQLAMIEMKIKQNPDVQRNVMEQQYRDLDSKTARDLRDWIILRDYIGALHFISTVFAHFKEQEDTKNMS